MIPPPSSVCLISNELVMLVSGIQPAGSETLISCYWWSNIWPAQLQTVSKYIQNISTTSGQHSSRQLVNISRIVEQHLASTAPNSQSIYLERQSNNWPAQYKTVSKYIYTSIRTCDRHSSIYLDSTYIYLYQYKNMWPAQLYIVSTYIYLYQYKNMWPPPLQTVSVYISILVEQHLASPALYNQ